MPHYNRVPPERSLPDFSHASVAECGLERVRFDFITSDPAPAWRTRSNSTCSSVDRAKFAANARIVMSPSAACDIWGGRHRYFQEVVRD